MRDLMSRLTAVDPDASEALRIIAYFDSLTEAHAGLEAVLRGAAVLSGATVGFVDTSLRLAMRVNSGARQMPPPSLDLSSIAWPHRQVGHELSLVWLELEGAVPASAQIILERSATAMRIVIDRTRVRASEGGDEGAIEVLLDLNASVDDIRRAATKLGLNLTAKVRLEAVDVTSATVPRLSILREVDVGRYRLNLVPEGRSSELRSKSSGVERRGGTPFVPLTEVATAAHQAMIALRLTTHLFPHVEWSELGTLGTLLSADTDSTRSPDPDEVNLARALDRPWAAASVEALLATDSLRGASSMLNLHHSTLLSRRDQLSADLGYDIATPHGRLRLWLAFSLNLYKRPLPS